MRGDHPDFGSTNTCVRERRFDRAREGIAVFADREQALSVGRGAAAEHFAQDGGVARAGGFLGLQRERCGAFTEEAAVAARVERADRVLR